MRNVIIHRSDGNTSEMTVIDDEADIAALVAQWESAQFIDEHGESSNTPRYTATSWEIV